MIKLRLKKGDTVQVLTGKDRGKTGEILQVFPKELKVLVSGINEVKKHTKPSKTSQGGIVTKNLPIHISNVAYFDKAKNKPSKLGYKMLEDGKKKRLMKASGEIIE